MDFDKNIPIPTSNKGGWPKKYFFDQMQIMDSQEFPIEMKGAINAVSQRLAKRLGLRFRIRANKDTVRIWRIK